MSININKYDVNLHVAEFYDREETSIHDFLFIKKLLSSNSDIRILEPFCGTGRILVPLAKDGHSLVGIDQSKAMLARAKMKIENLDEDIQANITLLEEDVLTTKWPQNFDLVILGGNCFYELGLPEEQEKCIQQAADALSPGGHLYIENDNMEGELPKSWQERGVKENLWPTGVCADGTRLTTSVETLWTDRKKRIWKAQRIVTAYYLDGHTENTVHEVQTHPCSANEIKEWLIKNGFKILGMYSNVNGDQYYPGCGRAIFWVKK